MAAEEMEAREELEVTVDTVAPAAKVEMALRAIASSMDRPPAEVRAVMEASVAKPVMEALVVTVAKAATVVISM